MDKATIDLKIVTGSVRSRPKAGVAYLPRACAGRCHVLRLLHAPELKSSFGEMQEHGCGSVDPYHFQRSAAAARAETRCATLDIDHNVMGVGREAQGRAKHHVDALAYVHGLAYSRGTAGQQEQQGGQRKERGRGHSCTIRAHLCRRVVVPYASR